MTDLIEKPAIIQLEEFMQNFPQPDIPLTHIHMGGIYIRQIQVKAGILVVGKRHRFNVCNILMSGKMRIMIDGQDDEGYEITGPHIFESEPFSKKVFYCVEDCVFLNVLPTSEMDVDKIEDHFIIKEDDYNRMIQQAV